jgi:hypothetical protein
MGDRRSRTTSKATETTPAPSTNAATQVQTVADLKPTEIVKAEEVKVEKVPEVKAEAKELPAAVIKEDLVAHFVRDAVADGTNFSPNTVSRRGISATAAMPPGPLDALSSSWAVTTCVPLILITQLASTSLSLLLRALHATPRLLLVKRPVSLS